MAGKHYPLWFRQEVVCKHLEKGVSISQLSEEYELNRSQILDWYRWQRVYGIPKQMTGKRKGRPKASGDESLTQKVKRLEMGNDLLKKLNELLMEEETKLK